MEDRMISVEGLTKRFGDVTAVDDISFSIERRKVTGFLGPNGSGKTTTIRMIIGLARPSAGSATIAGSGFIDLKDPARTVGVLLDGAGAHPKRTGRAHLRALAAERRVRRSRVDETLEVVGLTDAADRLVGGYSLGMRQRLDLAAALLGEPELLILDEPGNGLDPAGMRWLRDFLRSFAAGGGSVFVSSHQLAEISQLADEVVVVNRGRLVTQTSVAELTSERGVKLRTPQIDMISDALRAAGAAVLPLDDERVDISGLAIEDVGMVAAREGVVIYELSPAAHTLEEVFLNLTTMEGAAR